MASLSNLQHNKDPKETLSGEELLNLLMEYCNSQIRENSKIEREFSKDLTNDKIDIVMKAFRDGIASVAEGFHGHIRASNTNLTDVEFKLDTFVSYFDQHLQSLSKSLETVTGALNNHIKQCHKTSPQNSCQVCKKADETEEDLCSHDCTTHVPTTWSPCPTCGKMFSCEKELEDHYSVHHNGEVSFTCINCAKSFTTKTKLNEHQVLHHMKSVFVCSSCHLTFQSEEGLVAHTRSYHEGSLSYPQNALNCNIQCETDSGSQGSLEVHIQNNHDETPAFNCYKCDQTFSTHNDLAGHTLSFHPVSHNTEQALCFEDIQVASIYNEDCIPQCDGNDSLVSLDSTSSYSFVPPPNVRNAPFTLNKEKQMSTLAKNASLNNFEREVTGPTNVNIQCSTGFYQVVAKPVLQGLLVPNLIVAGLTISCSDPITPKLDQLRRNVNAVLHFKVGDNGVQESATVHLHHTQQKVQVQGRAAQWFVDNVLHEAFTKEAKANELKIRNINSQVSLAATRPSRATTMTDSSICCFYCKKQCRTKPHSKSPPAYCNNCSQYFHNTKAIPCFLSHVCPVSTIPVTTHSVLSSADHLASLDSTGQPPSVTVSSSSMVTIATPSAPSVHSLQSSCSMTSSHRPTFMPTTTVVAPPNAPFSQAPSTPSLDPNAANFVPQHTPISQPVAIHDPVRAQRTKQKSRKEPTAPQKDPKDVEIDFLKRELNIAKVALLEHETEVKDLKRKNKVLADTVNLLENNKQEELANKYTSRPSDSTSSRPGPPTSQPSCSCKDPAAVIEPNVLNKVLNLLSDLVRINQPDGVSQTLKCTHNCPASSPNHSAVSETTSSSSDPNARNPKPQGNSSSVTFPNLNDSPHSLSVNSLDEFASDLSIESCGKDDQLPDQLLDQVPLHNHDHLNREALTTQ